MSMAFLNTTSLDNVIKLEEKSVHYTENGDFEVTAEGSLLGKVKVKVNVPGGGEAKLEESGSFTVKENGEYGFYPENPDAVFSDVSVKVDVFVPESVDKNIVVTENGLNIYYPEEGKVFSSVRVVSDVKEKISQGLEFKKFKTPDISLAPYRCLSGLGTCTDTSIYVPSVANDGYPVVSVGGIDYETEANLSFSCNGVERLFLPDTVTSIGRWGIALASSLKYVKFGRYFVEVGESQHPDGATLSGVTFDFTGYKRTTPPILTDTSFLNGVEQVIVPASMVDAWKGATNWSRVADKIVGV